MEITAQQLFNGDLARTHTHTHTLALNWINPLIWARRLSAFRPMMDLMGHSVMMAFGIQPLQTVTDMNVIWVKYHKRTLDHNRWTKFSYRDE